MRDWPLTWADPKVATDDRRDFTSCESAVLLGDGEDTSGVGRAGGTGCTPGEEVMSRETSGTAREGVGEELMAE